MNKIKVNHYIVTDPQICHGKPTFIGTRIMVWQVLEMLSSGESEKKITDAFPKLNRNHIKAALDYASSVTKQGHVLINTQPQIYS